MHVRGGVVVVDVADADGCEFRDALRARWPVAWAA
jgi:hypothetical protein